MADAATLLLALKAHDEASAALHKAAGTVEETSGSMVGHFTKVGLAAAAMGVAAVGALFKLGESFDTALDTIVIGTGASGTALDGLKEDFEAVFANVPTDAGLASQAIADINTRLGLTGPALQDSSAAALEFTRLFGGTLPENVRLATRVMGDWGLETDQLPALLDKVAKASQLTGIPVADLMGKVVQFGAPLRAMNFSLDQSVAFLGKWEKEGVNTELVLGSLRIAMGGFAKDNIPMRKGLEDTIAKITALGPGAAATTLAMETFGARAGADMAAAILEGRFALGDLVAQLESAGGTVMDTAAQTADGAEAMKLAWNRAQLALAPLADAVFTFVGTQLTAMIERFETVQTPMEAVRVMLGFMRSAILEVTGVNIPLVTGFDTVVRTVRDVITTSQEFIIAFKNNELAVLTLQAALITLTSVAIAKALIALPAMIVSIWASVTAFAAQAVAAGTAAVATALAALPFIALVTAIGLAVLAVLWIIKHWGELQSKATEVFGSIRDTVVTVWGRIEQTIKDAVNNIIGFINRMIRAWNSISLHVPSVPLPFGGSFGGFDIGVPHIPEIPRLVHGGTIMRAGTAIVGERGPELLSLPRGATVQPLGGPTINITIEGNVYGEVDFETKVAAAWTRVSRAGGFGFVGV